MKELAGLTPFTRRAVKEHYEEETGRELLGDVVSETSGLLGGTELSAGLAMALRDVGSIEQRLPELMACVDQPFHFCDELGVLLVCGHSPSGAVAELRAAYDRLAQVPRSVKRFHI